MQKSVTTRFRLPRDLLRRVERRAARAGCGLNEFIVEALKSHLGKNGQASFWAEARRQSRLAAKLDAPDAPWDMMVERDFPVP